MNINSYYLINNKNFNKIIDFSSKDDSKYYTSLDTLNKTFINQDISIITKYSEYDNDYVYLNINNVITPKFIKFFPLIDNYNLINKQIFIILIVLIL